MNFRNISAWSIRNPVPSLVLFAFLTLAGIMSFMRMDVTNMPDIDFPAVNISVAQPGAAPSELETQVTQRIEAAVRGINGVEEINSSASEGVSNTNVQFTVGTPVDRAVNDVRNAVSQIRSNLPEGILEPQVNRMNIGGGPIAQVTIESTGMTLEQLSWYVDNTVARRLLGVDGMAAVTRNGGVNREIRVILDPARMQAYGLSASQVNAQLRQVNLNATGGRAEIAGAEQSLRVIGNSQNAYSLGQTQISVGNGRTVRLSDIADVRDSFAEQRSLSQLNGRQVLSFQLEKAKGTSDLAVFDAAKIELDKIQEEDPRVKFFVRFNSTKYTRMQYDSAMEALIEGAVLAVLVVFLFLRDWRATIISAIAIPLSAIPTFWFMELMGFSLNGLSLLALSLVAGVLVDDAIVEIENIVRHMRMGKSAYQASIDAADEIGLAVVATTFSIVAVFLPVGLMPGITGQFFKQFGLTVVVSVLMSLAVARLVTPMVAAYFLRPHGTASHGEGWLMDRYMSVLRWTLRHRWKTVAVGAAAFVGTIFTFMTLPVTFQPQQDQDFSRISLTMAPGTTLEQTRQTVDRVSNLLRAQPDVDSVFGNFSPGSGYVFVNLKQDRAQPSYDFERSVAPQLAQIPDARVNFLAQSGGGPGSGRALTIYLGSSDPVLLYQAAQRVLQEMGQMNEVRAPRIEGDLRRPEIVIRPHFDLAADMGVTTAALGNAIRTATLGEIEQNSAKFSLSDRQVPISVSFGEDSRRSLANIENMPVPTSNGGSVPLKTIAEISFGAGPTTIQRTGQVRRIAISADLAPGAVPGQVYGKVMALPTLRNLPEGVQILTLGDAKFQLEMLGNFINAVVAGIFLVFCVLVLLYRRLMAPFVNLGSLLLAPLGGGLALHIAQQPVSMPVFIGLLMLLGIVAKNSILLIDFALEEMNKGVGTAEAIIDAGHKRAQPIVMTTVAMVAGMIPTALSLNGDSSWRAPMGVTVIGGLTVSTLLTLLIVPASFSLALGFERWLGPRLGRWFTNGGKNAPAPAAAADGEPAVHPAE